MRLRRRWGARHFSRSGSEHAAFSDLSAVTKTFDKPGFIDIPGGGSIGPALPYPSVRFFGELGFPRGAKIVDVNLTLEDFGHSAPDDVDMMLAHKGVNRTIMSDVGGFDNVDNLNLILDDEAQTALPTSLLAGGRFRPFNSGDLDGFPAPAPTQNPRAAQRLRRNGPRGFMEALYSRRRQL